jgi:ubiquinone/menaquinone biosynthesis C-methylase UbiE
VNAEVQTRVAAWFDAVYRERGLRYLRPAAAYGVYLQLLRARPGESLLDVGCGPGLLLEHAVARGMRTAGVDLSAAAVAMAHTRLPEASVRAGNAESLPFADASFDCVSAIAALERVIDRGRALREMARVGKPAARYCVMVRNADTPVWRLWRQALGRREVDGHQDALPLREWRQLFVRHGFRVADVVPDQWPRQRLRRWLGLRPAPGAEPLARGLLPLRFAPQFVFLLEKAGR